MGMDRRVTPGPKNFAWGEFAALLASKDVPVQMRMIDGQLSFPDEAPPENWRELRIACSAGMITLRREGAAIVIVTWGNADAELQRCWNAVASAVAAATDGQVDEHGL